MIGARLRTSYNGHMKRLFLLILLCVLTACGDTQSPTPPRTVEPTALSAPGLPPNTVAPAQTIPVTPTAAPTIGVPTAVLESISTTVPAMGPTLEPTSEPTAVPIAQATDPVLVGAGDIAVCRATGDEATARILDRIEGTVFTLGDNVYLNGTAEEFQTCFQESWGRHKARIRPVPGNHDYNTPNATGYYAYFGEAAGDPTKGYYSYDLGAWHIVVLNSEVDTELNSAQAQWLREDLAAHPALCTVAMMHRPLFSSGPHGRDGSGEKSRPLWEVLYENNVDLILNGHEHTYERFAPQNPQGEPDVARGIRQIVVGTGGAVPYPFGEPKPNSEKRIAGPFGVLKLTLHETAYDWNFVSVAPLLFGDRGTGECH